MSGTNAIMAAMNSYLYGNHHSTNWQINQQPITYTPYTHSYFIHFISETVNLIFTYNLLDLLGFFSLFTALICRTHNFVPRIQEDSVTLYTMTHISIAPFTNQDEFRSPLNSIENKNNYSEQILSLI